MKRLIVINNRQLFDAEQTRSSCESRNFSFGTRYRRPKMTWKEELNLLTMFHEKNVGFLDRKGNINSNLNVMKEEEDEKKTESEEEAKYVKIKSLGRGRKIPSGNEELFIAKVIEETLGVSHRSESMFSQEVHQPSAARRRSYSPAGHRLPGG